MATIPGYGGGTSWRTSVRIARSSTAPSLSAAAATVRRHDHDRFQTVLFAPAARREALFALYAFNYEIARVRETVREPALGEIRLEWWRQAVGAAYGEAPPPRHPVALALAAAVRAAAPARGHFDRLIDARIAALDAAPPADLTALEARAEDTSSPLVLLALEILGARDPAAAETGRRAGIAYGLSGMLRALPAAADNGRWAIPADLAARHGLDRDDDRGWRDTPALRAVVADIAAAAGCHLEFARAARRAVPRPALAALLPVVIAARTLDRLARDGYDPFAPALARRDPWQSWRLTLAALRRRF